MPVVTESRKKGVTLRDENLCLYCSDTLSNCGPPTALCNSNALIYCVRYGRQQTSGRNKVLMESENIEQLLEEMRKI